LQQQYKHTDISTENISTEMKKLAGYLINLLIWFVDTLFDYSLPLLGGWNHLDCENMACLQYSRLEELAGSTLLDFTWNNRKISCFGHN